MNKLSDYIMVVPDVVGTKLCQQIIGEFVDENEWLASAIGTGRVDTTIRNVQTIILSYPHVVAVNPLARKEIDDALYVCAAKAISAYNEKFPLARVEEDSGYELLRYGVGQFYTEHVDSCKARPREVSCSFSLNDDYEGGEWKFFGGEYVVKVPKGGAILFPSNFMYPHQIAPVTSGVRYSVITWFI